MCWKLGTIYWKSRFCRLKHDNYICRVSLKEVYTFNYIVFNIVLTCMFPDKIASLLPAPATPAGTAGLRTRVPTEWWFQCTRNVNNSYLTLLKKEILSTVKFMSLKKVKPFLSYWLIYSSVFIFLLVIRIYSLSVLTFPDIWQVNPSTWCIINNYLYSLPVNSFGDMQNKEGKEDTNKIIWGIM